MLPGGQAVATLIRIPNCLNDPSPSPDFWASLKTRANGAAPLCWRCRVCEHLLFWSAWPRGLQRGSAGWFLADLMALKHWASPNGTPNGTILDIAYSSDTVPVSSLKHIPRIETEVCESQTRSRRCNRLRNLNRHCEPGGTWEGEVVDPKPEVRTRFFSATSLGYSRTPPHKRIFDV